MRFLLFVLLFCNTVCAQSVPLELRITSLEKMSDDGERKFRLNYTLTNLTNQKLSFFFNPDGFGGAMSNRPFYKCYQNDEYLDSGNLLTSHSGNSMKIDLNTLDFSGKTEEEQVALIRKFIRETVHLDLDSIAPGITDKELLKNISQKSAAATAMQNLFVLLPNETKTYTELLYWDKKRYFTVDPHEYYIEATAKHEFEITLVLMKEILKDKIPDEDFATMMADKSFIKGVFTSNRIPIDFAD